MTDLTPYQLVSPVSAGESEDLLADKSKEDGLCQITSLVDPGDHDLAVC